MQKRCWTFNWKHLCRGSGNASEADKKRVLEEVARLGSYSGDLVSTYRTYRETEARFEDAKYRFDETTIRLGELTRRIMTAAAQIEEKEIKKRV